MKKDNEIKNKQSVFYNVKGGKQSKLAKLV